MQTSGTTLTELTGVGDITAATILAHVAGIERFPSPAAFASYNGTAPLEVSSGDTTVTDSPALATVN